MSCASFLIFDGPGGTGNDKLYRSQSHRDRQALKVYDIEKLLLKTQVGEISCIVKWSESNNRIYLRLSLYWFQSSYIIVDDKSEVKPNTPSVQPPLIPETYKSIFCSGGSYPGPNADTISGLPVYLWWTEVKAFFEDSLGQNNNNWYERPVCIYPGIFLH